MRFLPSYVVQILLKLCNPPRFQNIKATFCQMKSEFNMVTQLCVDATLGMLAQRHSTLETSFTKMRYSEFTRSVITWFPTQYAQPSPSYVIRYHFLSPVLTSLGPCCFPISVTRRMNFSVPSSQIIDPFIIILLPNVNVGGQSDLTEKFRMTCADGNPDVLL